MILVLLTSFCLKLAFWQVGSWCFCTNLCLTNLVFCFGLVWIFFQMKLFFFGFVLLWPFLLHLVSLLSNFHSCGSVCSPLLLFHSGVDYRSSFLCQCVPHLLYPSECHFHLLGFIFSYCWWLFPCNDVSWFTVVFLTQAPNSISNLSSFLWTEELNMVLGICIFL